MKKFMLSLLLTGCIGLIAAGQDEEPQNDTTKTEKPEDSKAPLPLKPERTFRLTTDEGTWISLDVSPDGSQIAFDLMGDLYLLPIGGGQAERITEGLAYDTHPKFSPDGKQLAFTSDRSGSENLWYIDFEKDDTVQVTKHKDQHVQSGDWTADGEYLVVSRGIRNLKLDLLHKDGGGGTALIKEPDNLKCIEPAPAPDGRHIWFSRRNSAWNYNAQMPQYQLATYDRETGEISTETNRYGSAFSPALSPDGNWLVYGTRHNAQTGLVKRNLESGEEDWLAYPVQRDEQESIAPLGVYPAMSFTPDSKHLVCSYGGKIWKIPLDGGDAMNIPFEVDVDIEMGPLVQFDYPISDEPQFTVTQIRDARLSPDGSKLAFTALNRLYVMDYPDGEPVRLTDHDFTEAMPAWSDNGREVAFVTWESGGGHVYKINAAGGTPSRLTREVGTYQSPAWDGKTGRIVLLAGPAEAYKNAVGPFAFGATQHIAWIPADGGELTVIEKANGRSNPHFVGENDRIYLFHGQKGLLSIRWDGTDEKQHVKVTGITTYPALVHDHSLLPQEMAQEPERRPSSASVITMAPDGSRALAKINNEIYTVTVPRVGGEVPAISVSNPENAAFPARKLTEMGGEFPAWTAGGDKVYWSLGNAFFLYDLEEARRVDEEIRQKKKEEAKAKADTTKEEGAEGQDEALEDEEEDEKYEAAEHRIIVMAERDMPEGRILLRRARVITMKGDEIFERGDILIENNRIVQVGPSGSIRTDGETTIMDMRGKTIVPGFVDTHSHMWPNWGLQKNVIWNYLANLAYGVTTTRDPQTATSDVLTYSDMVVSGDMIGPRVYSTGPGVGFWAYNLKSQEQARDVLRQYSEYYNTKTIKMYLVGNRQHRQWVIQAAKEQKLMPTTEGGLDYKLNMTQLLDGYPGHEHSFPIAPLYKDVIQLVAQSQMAYTPTLLVAYGGPWAENYFYSRENPQYDRKLNHFTPKPVLDAKTRRRPGWFMDEEHVFEKHAVFVKDLVEAGGIAGVGSHSQLDGLGYHWELWAMATGGISNHDALKTATILGAKAIGLSKDLGSIEPGKIADLVILNENPLADLRSTNTIQYVMKNGRLYDGDTLDEVYPREQKAPDFYWSNSGPAGSLPGVRR